MFPDSAAFRLNEFFDGADAAHRPVELRLQGAPPLNRNHTMIRHRWKAAAKPSSGV
jgi:hypothetical protein